MKLRTLLAAATLAVSISAVAQRIKIEPVELFEGSSVINPFVCDTVLYFASDKKNSHFKGNFDADGNRLYQLYEVDLYCGRPEGTPRTYFVDANRKAHTLAVAVTSSEAFVTQNNLDEPSSKGNPLGIYAHKKTSRKGDGQLVFKQPKRASVCYPSISPDGLYMIFASDMEGGEGSSDLYLSQLQRNGTWGEPINLGPKINTPGVETTPFIHSSGKIFFASNGREDSRKLDIYYTYRTETGFAEPVRFDIGINSIGDDYSFYYSPDEEWGYLCSNRFGQDKIFYFEQEFPDFDQCYEMEQENYCFTFYESSIENYDPDMFAFRWNFSDGYSVVGVEADHCFAGPGEYFVSLNVLDKTSHEELFAIAEYPIELRRPEQVNIIHPTKITVGRKVYFDANAANLTFKPANYYWDFGNGVKAKGKNAAVTFDKPGYYMIKCGTVADEDPTMRVCTWVELQVTK